MLFSRLNNEDSNGIQCCEEDGSGPISKLVQHPECFPIEIPSNDPFFFQFGQRCMNFVRWPSQSLTRVRNEILRTFLYKLRIQSHYFVHTFSVLGGLPDTGPSPSVFDHSGSWTVAVFRWDIISRFRVWKSVRIINLLSDVIASIRLLVL